MFLTEFDEEKYLQMVREEEREDGLSEGIEIGTKLGRSEGLKLGRSEGHSSGLRSALLTFLQGIGIIPDAFADRLEKADDSTLTDWISFAAKSSSIDEFLKHIG